MLDPSRAYEREHSYLIRILRVRSLHIRILGALCLGSSSFFVRGCGQGTATAYSQYPQLALYEASRQAYLFSAQRLGLRPLSYCTMASNTTTDSTVLSVRSPIVFQLNPLRFTRIFTGQYSPSSDKAT